MKKSHILRLAFSVILTFTIILASSCSCSAPAPTPTPTPVTTPTPTPTPTQTTAPDRTPPTVSSIFPNNADIGVAINSAITAIFSKVMDPSTLTNVIFTLMQGTTPVTGTVTPSGDTATFRPAVNLAASTSYTVTMSTGAKDVSGNALANDFVSTFTTGVAPDTTPPMVSATVPANAATGVVVNNAISAFFNEAIDPLTVTPATFFTLKQGLTPVAGTVTSVGTSAVFTPAGPLASSSLYTATLTTGAKDLAGNPLASNYTWSFTTTAGGGGGGGGGGTSASDTTPPMVSSTSPLNAATGVAFNSAISAVFSEAMSPLTVTTATFILKNGTTPVNGTVTPSGDTATFTPLGNLTANTTYTATLTTGVNDLAGNALASNYSWSFTTGVAPDTTPPTVSSTIPANLATGVAFNSAIAATFSEAIRPSTVTPATFILQQGTTPVNGTVTPIGATATFKPTGNLTANTPYTATVTTGVQDLAGNSMASNYTWSFTTGLTPDITPPTVSSTTPANLATGVAFNSKINATFSEAMNPSTVNNVTFNLKQGTTPVNGMVNYANVTATFTPAGNLTANTTYTATLISGVSGVKDLAGNALASNYTWSFTTANATVVTTTVISTIPISNATSVTINSIVNAIFSKAMNSTTVNNVTFTLQQGTTPVAGNVTYAGFTATFTPALNLAVSTIYNATVTTGVKDLVGNALASNYTWSFTTAGLVPGAVPLSSAATYGIMATGSTTSIGATVINGDVLLNPGTSQGIPPAQINGQIHIDDQVAIDAQTDLTTAYNFAWARPKGFTMTPGADQGAIYSTGMAPGVYWSESTMLINTPLVLDAGGNANAVWVFQIGSSLTTYVGVGGLPGGNVLLRNNAQAKNVFFVPVMDVTIGVDTTFNGTILAGRDVTGQTRATINGRMLAGALGAGVIALDTNTVNVPAP